MAKTTPADWEKAKALFEAGKSLSEINAETGIDGSRVKAEISTLSSTVLNVVEKEIEERTKHIQFFTNAAIKNVQESMSLQCVDQSEFKARADTILKGKETVLGKESAMVINNTNAQQNNPDPIRFTRAPG